MRFSVRRSLPVLLLAGLAFTALSCSDTTEPPAGATVQVADNSFNPTSATVAAGGTVTWQWAGATGHNVTWVTASTNSPTQATGTYTRAFSAAGSYDYYCTLHGTATTGMRGTVTVQ
jgi:plastocyanin